MCLTTRVGVLMKKPASQACEAPRVCAGLALCDDSFDLT